MHGGRMVETAFCGAEARFGHRPYQSKAQHGSTHVFSIANHMELALPGKAHNLTEAPTQTQKPPCFVS
jgi:hypothetical protein